MAVFEPRFTEAQAELTTRAQSRTRHLSAMLNALVHGQGGATVAVLELLL